LLLDSQIGDAANVAEFVEHLVSHALIAYNVGTINLNVDRRRKTEIKRLSHNVSWQEIEGGAGIFTRKLFPQRTNVVRVR
jgi:hypothetical protein